MNVIVAVDEDWGIGFKGQLLAKINDDLANFKKETLNKTVIYGTNTLLTFPNQKPLKNRRNIILNPDKNFLVEGAEIAHSIEEALDMVKNEYPKNVYVIGGASIYQQFLPYYDEAIITMIYESYPNKDAYFPNLSKLDGWIIIDNSKLHYDSDNNVYYRFTKWKLNKNGKEETLEDADGKYVQQKIQERY